MPSTIIRITYRQLFAREPIRTEHDDRGMDEEVKRTYRHVTYQSRDPIRTEHSDAGRDEDIERAYRHVPARSCARTIYQSNDGDPIRTEHSDAGRDEDVERAYRHVPARGHAGIVYRSSAARSNEQSIRSSYRHVATPCSARAERDTRYIGRNEGTSRQTPRREQTVPYRHSSRRPPHYTPSHQDQLAQTEDTTPHSSHHRTRRAEPNHGTPDRAPSGGPRDHTGRFSRSALRSGNTSHTSSRQTHPPREQTHRTKPSSNRQISPLTFRPRRQGSEPHTPPLAVSHDATTEKATFSSSPREAEKPLGRRKRKKKVSECGIGPVWSVVRRKVVGLLVGRRQSVSLKKS